MPTFYRWVGFLLLGALWWKALDPPSMLRIWIFGLWGLAAFFIFWTFANTLERPTPPPPPPEDQ